jgi:RNA polymerase sigma factor (sigma-70 family)
MSVGTALPAPRSPAPDVATADRTTTDLTTPELVQAARLRDPRAWEELVRRYEGMVRAVVGSYRMGEADTADAVQNTWLRALERLGAIRDPERLGGWLATTARRETLALLRVQARHVPRGLADPDVPATGPDPEATALAHEVHRVVRRAVADLPQNRQALVVALFAAPDTRYREVSRALDLPPGSIGPIRGRVLRTLRGTLERGGLDAESVA